MLAGVTNKDLDSPIYIRCNIECNFIHWSQTNSFYIDKDNWQIDELLKNWLDNNTVTKLVNNIQH